MSKKDKQQNASSANNSVHELNEDELSAVSGDAGTPGSSTPGRPFPSFMYDTRVYKCTCGGWNTDPMWRCNCGHPNISTHTLTVCFKCNQYFNDGGSADRHGNMHLRKGET